MYLSAVGAGLIVLPTEAIRAFAVAGVPGAVAAGVDGGVASQGYFLTAKLAVPTSVSIGALNVTWSGDAKNNSGHYVSLRVGGLSTQMPINCPGKGVLLQLDAQVGDYAAKISNVRAQSDTVAARVEYNCTVDNIGPVAQ